MKKDMFYFKKMLLIGAIGLVLYGCGPAKALQYADKATIVTQMDLVNVVDDRVLVTVDPGVFNQDTITFFIPKIVPGTYSLDNYGKYVEGLKAIDYKGNELSVNRLDDNSWQIANAKELDKLTYLVNDTYDTEQQVADKVFSPAGTNILSGENYMLNLHGFIGYFNGLKEIPYRLEIKVPNGLSGATSLKKLPTEPKLPGVDVYWANRYFEVIDNPILYAKPNTETFQINDISVTLSVYSPNGIYTAAGLKADMERMMRAQKQFLGDINSTKQYTILLYFSTLNEDDAIGFGALEHHTSTTVVLPEQMPREMLVEALVDVVSHEFFHIVTPLSIHSKEIKYFDFNDPKMSKHLWMYEGTTEYFANLFQIQQGLIDEENFYERLMEKVQNAKAYNDSQSFTEMSKNVLEEPYKENYGNVYEKGALINMALDIRLRELSHGEKGVLWLMKQLSQKYGNHIPFEDEALFNEIVAMTYPELNAFFDTYVIGNTPINYEEFWEKVGLTVTSVIEESGFFLMENIPFIDVDPSKGDAVFIREDIPLNSFLKNLDVQGGDIIKSINDKEISVETMREIIGESFGWAPDKEITMRVLRDGQPLLLKSRAGTPVVTLEVLVPMENASEKQLKLREHWLKG
ncbi:peptidase M61 [Arenibacter sp. 6A1]|uniref:M61 family metallopeptidase n=1 Tax=Arenibacter sp. 6A1 TaxID=2720391 RepID=UPI0014453E64|nr:peptidase M61 [Arenibacter sp. 6A1]NKI25536.1 peptidase M61 [Arenibacter sp. 6A1]